jgi:DNA-binding PadR family transcriptional regulator
MSGAEIVEIIEHETRGFWKPSSGSIYPLLARLQEKGYTIESSIEEIGLKRYSLTDKGNAFFKNQVQLGHRFLTKLEYLVPIFLGGFHFTANHEHMRIVGDAAKRLAKIFIDARTTIRDNITPQYADKIAAILNACADQLEHLTQRITDKESA